MTGVKGFRRLNGRGPVVGQGRQRLAERRCAQGLLELFPRQAPQLEAQEGVAIKLTGQTIVDPGDVLAGIGIVGAGAR
jgi:hypothetical protein